MPPFSTGGEPACSRTFAIKRAPFSVPRHTFSRPPPKSPSVTPQRRIRLIMSAEPTSDVPPLPNLLRATRLPYLRAFSSLLIDKRNVHASSWLSLVSEGSAWSCVSLQITHAHVNNTTALWAIRFPADVLGCGGGPRVSGACQASHRLCPSLSSSPLVRLHHFGRWGRQGSRVGGACQRHQLGSKLVWLHMCNCSSCRNPSQRRSCRRRRPLGVLGALGARLGKVI